MAVILRPFEPTDPKYEASAEIGSAEKMRAWESRKLGFVRQPAWITFIKEL